MLIGEFDENYDFINPKNIIRLSSKTNELDYSFAPLKQGDNLIMGKIYIRNDSALDGELLQRELIFYKDFYVKGN